MTKAEARHALDKARHAIVMKFPFIGEISLRVDLIPTKDAKNPTSTTDGSKVYIDMDFMDKLEKKDLSFVIGHEIWHSVLLHPARKQTRDQKLFDLACDMEVNWLMHENNNGHAFRLPCNCPLPPFILRGEPAEKIYDWLLKNCSKSSSGKDNDSNGSNGSQDSQDSSSKDSNSQDSSSQDGQEWSCTYTGENGSSIASTINEHLHSRPKKDKSIDGQFDVHRYIDGSEQTEDDGSGNADSEFQPCMSKNFCEEMREATISQLQKCALGQGSVPIGLERFIKKLEKPEVPWQEQLAQFVTQIHTGKLEWTPPNRRHLYQDLYLQSHRTKKISIALAIDTSGSTAKVLPKFFGEMESLVKSFDSYTIHRLDCDCDVQQHIVYDSDTKPFTRSASESISWAGGGGTSFSPVIDYIASSKLDVDALVYLTDGYGYVYDSPPPYPVLWVLPTDGSKDFCNWGKKIFFKSTSCGWA